MREFLIMIGLSILMAVAAFALPGVQKESLKQAQKQAQKQVGPEEEARKSESVSKGPELPLALPQDVKGPPVVTDTTSNISSGLETKNEPENDDLETPRLASTITSTNTSRSVHTGSGAIPSTPRGMPPRRPKPSGFR